MTAAAFEACTIVTASHLARAQVLAASLAAVHPEVRLSVLVIDAPPRTAAPPPGTDLLDRTALALTSAEYLEMAAIYSPLELSCALKPFAAAALLGAGAPRVVYLDADVLVLGRLDGFARDADATGLALAPHVRGRPVAADGSTDVEGVVLGSGLVNMGMFAVAPPGAPFLEWWADHLRRECVDDVPRQRFVDQRWVDVALMAFPHTICTDPGINAGWWSLGGAAVTRSPEGTVLVDDVPLRALHLSGFSLDQPYLLSSHSGPRPRTLLSGSPVLADVLDRYSHDLHEAGDVACRGTGYGFDHLAPGVEYDNLMRVMFRNALLAHERRGDVRPPDPFGPEGPEDFISWLAAPTGALGAAHALTRYESAMYASSPGIRMQFPDIAGGDAARFAAWCAGPERPFAGLMRAMAELPAPETHTPLVADCVVVADATREAHTEDSAVADALDSALIAAGSRAVRVDALRSGEPTAAERARLGNRPPDVAAALLVGDLDALPPLRHAILSQAPQVPRLAYVPWHGSVAPPAMDEPGEFARAWAVASAFTAASFTAAGLDDVRVVGLPVRAAEPQGVRAGFGHAEAFVAYAQIDLGDGGVRHDPEPVIRALDLIRGEGRDTHLVLGLRGADEYVPAAERVHWLARGRADVTVIDAPSGTPDGDPWIAEADVVLSLHRTEGFAWAAATAMASGTPVVATRYGGNLDYMDASNAELVEPASLSALDVAIPGAAAGSLLADLEPSAIAIALASVRASGGASHRATAREVVVRRFSPQVVGAALVDLPGVGPASVGGRPGLLRRRKG